MAKSFYYSDFDLNIRPHPVTGDIVMKYDVQAVLQSCRNLLLTATEEIVMNMDIGGGISRMLFELNAPSFTITLKEKIIEVLTTYEPRIEIENLEVMATNNQHTIVIRLTFYILNQPDPVTVDLPLKRTR